MDVEAGLGPTPQPADASDKHMEEFFKEVTGIKVAQDTTHPAQHNPSGLRLQRISASTELYTGQQATHTIQSSLHITQHVPNFCG